jgi:hypothetical protein
MKENLYKNAPIRETVHEECICKNCIRILWTLPECQKEGFQISLVNIGVYRPIKNCTGFQDYRKANREPKEE